MTLIAVAGLTIRADLFASSDTQQNILNPRGRIHIPTRLCVALRRSEVGIANSLDTLKTFVEAEGNFSPGVNGLADRTLTVPSKRSCCAQTLPERLVLTLPTVGLHYCILERWATELADIQYVYHRLSAGRITQSKKNLYAAPFSFRLLPCRKAGLRCLPSEPAGRFQLLC